MLFITSIVSCDDNSYDDDGDDNNYTDDDDSNSDGCYWAQDEEEWVTVCEGLYNDIEGYGCEVFGSRSDCKANFCSPYYQCIMGSKLGTVDNCEQFEEDAADC